MDPIALSLLTSRSLCSLECKHLNFQVAVHMEVLATCRQSIDCPLTMEFVYKSKYAFRARSVRVVLTVRRISCNNQPMPKQI